MFQRILTILYIYSRFSLGDESLNWESLTNIKMEIPCTKATKIRISRWRIRDETNHEESDKYGTWTKKDEPGEYGISRGKF